MTRLVVLGVVLLAVAMSASGASASRADDTILNQMSAQDSVGGTVNGPDLSSLTVTSYADGTISFLVQFANRQFIQPNETVQIFIDLDDNGSADLNLSIWPLMDPSYLARWDGTKWSNIRELPELSQTPGQFSVRLSLAELQSAAAVGVAPTIGVSAGSWTEDPSTGQLEPNADDLLPDDGLWLSFPIRKPAPAPPSPPAKPSPARLTVECVDHKLTARVTPGNGSTVSSVSFSSNGTVHRTTQPPYVSTIATKGKAVVTIAVTVRTASGTQTLRARARACRS